MRIANTCPCHCSSGQRTHKENISATVLSPISQLRKQAKQQSTTQEQKEPAFIELPKPQQQSNRDRTATTVSKHNDHPLIDQNNSKPIGPVKPPEKREESINIVTNETTTAEQTIPQQQVTEHDRRMSQISYRHKIMEILALIQKMKVDYCKPVVTTKFSSQSSMKQRKQQSPRRTITTSATSSSRIDRYSTTLSGSGKTAPSNSSKDFSRKQLYIARKPVVRDYEKEPSRRAFNREYAKVFRQYI